ncbi:MAG: hypothetical protein MJA27_27925 [Pseudanabaenales cyanobacterium]|nr:hypothetical protein [Pseudanabaenales cyanobacterium]
MPSRRLTQHPPLAIAYQACRIVADAVQTRIRHLRNFRLELRVAQRALQGNIVAKDVMLMLVAGSPTVRQIHQTRGKQRAMEFASHIVRIAGLRRSQQVQDLGKKNITIIIAV